MTASSRCRGPPRCRGCRALWRTEPTQDRMPARDKGREAESRGRCVGTGAPCHPPAGPAPAFPKARPRKSPRAEAGFRRWEPEAPVPVGEGFCGWQRFRNSGFLRTAPALSGLWYSLSNGSASLSSASSAFRLETISKQNHQPYSVKSAWLLN